MIRDCKTCKQPKPVSEFYKNRLAKDGYELNCKTCKVQTARNQRRLWKIQAIEKKGGCCSICGGVFPPCVYDFHHTNDDKEVNPGKARSKSTFFAEIDKCDLVCSNCHRIIHHDQPF